MVSFRDLMYPPISLDGFKSLRLKQPKRICFGSTHRNALKQNGSGDWAGSLFVPFTESIAVLMPWRLFPNSGPHGGYRRGIKGADEFNEVQSWIEAHDDLVFIRSLFNTAVATCEHYVSNTARSPIGELEHRAKYAGDPTARDQLNSVVKHAFDRLHNGRGLSGILSVPPSNVGQVSLPNLLAAKLSADVEIPDLTSELAWNGPKGSIKEMGVEEKWQALDAVGLTVGDAVAGKDLLLIDDMYQSGATAHFVASRLRSAGANEIHLLAVSKGRRDTDNK